MLCRELSSPPVRLLLSLLVLKDAGRNHHPVPGVDQVVSHESWHFADDGYKALLRQARYLARVGYALIPPYRSVHSFCATSFDLRSTCRFKVPNPGRRKARPTISSTGP